MTERAMEPCKVHWCKPMHKDLEWQLEPIAGICLEEVGIPSKGRAVINRTIKPRVGDLVHCNNFMCTINGFIKQVQSFDGEEMVVTTRYKDHSKISRSTSLSSTGSWRWYLIPREISFIGGKVNGKRM